MKRTYFIAGAFCLVTMGSSRAMEQHVPSLKAASAVAQRLASTIELNVPLLLKLATLHSQGTIEKKELLPLIKCLKKDKVAELFSLPADTFERLIDTDNLIKYLTLVLEESHENEAQINKAKALRQSFRVDGWEDLLGCENLGPVLNNFTKLLYFVGTDDEKKTLLRKLKRAVEQLQPAEDAQVSKLERYFDLIALKSIIDDLLADKPVEQGRMTRVFKTDTALKNLSDTAKTIDTYAHTKNILAFIVTLLYADQDRSIPSVRTLVNFIRWDSLFINLPELLGYDVSIVATLCSLPHLRAQIALLQDGEELTADGLRTILNRETLDALMVTQEKVEECINFDLLAEGINALSRGEQSDALKRAFNVKALEGLLGKDIGSAFDTSLPEAVQTKKLAELLNHVSNPKWLIALCAAPMIIWLAGHTVCHPCIEALEPQNWYTAGPLLMGAVGLTYKGMQIIQKRKPALPAICNTIAVKTQRILAAMLPQRSTSLDELLEYTPSNQAYGPLFIAFVGMLTNEHIKELPTTLEILNLFDRPRTFVAKHGKFIESICTHDKERALDRIRIIQMLLENVLPCEQLPHKQEFAAFVNTAASNGALNELPHPGLIIIAQYCPHILLGQTACLEKASQSIIDNIASTTHFFRALSLAKEIQDIDLAL